MVKYRVYSYRNGSRKSYAFSTHKDLATAKQRAKQYREDGDRVVIRKVKTSTRRS